MADDFTETACTASALRGMAWIYCYLSLVRLQGNLHKGLEKNVFCPFVLNDTLKIALELGPFYRR